MTLSFLPNEDDATFNDQAEPDAVDYEILLLGFRQTGVVSGCDVTESSGSEMEIDVASGEALLAGVSVTVSAQADETIATADGSNPRVDLVTVNSGGTVVVTAGTAAANPVSPAIPANSVPLAFVYVPASDTTITDNQINDKRVFIVASASASTMFSWNRNEEETSVSSSSFAWKGSGVVPQQDVIIHALVFSGSTTGSATYQGAVITASGGTIATIDKTATYDTVSADIDSVDATLLLVFSTPIALDLGTEYWLMVGRTDSTDTHNLAVQYPANDYTYPFGGLPTISSKRVAKASPAVSDTLSDLDGAVVRIGVIWELA